MIRQLETVLLCNALLQLFNYRVDHFHGFSAAPADEVIVMRMVIVMLISQHAVAEIHFAREPGFGQQLQIAINGGLPDGRIALFDDIVELFCGDVFLAL